MGFYRRRGWKGERIKLMIHGAQSLSKVRLRVSNAELEKMVRKTGAFNLVDLYLFYNMQLL